MEEIAIWLAEFGTTIATGIMALITIICRLVPRRAKESKADKDFRTRLKELKDELEKEINKEK